MELPRDARTGKRRQHSETVKGTKKEAEHRLAELIDRIESNDFVRPERITFGQWLDRWYQSYVATNTRSRTAASYRDEIRVHIAPNLGRIPLSQLTPTVLEEYYARALASGRVDGKGGLASSTVLYHHRIISRCLKDAVRAGYLGRNVAEAIDPPRFKRKIMNTMALKDVTRFLQFPMETPYYRLYYTDIYTGLRLGEILGLPWRGLDLEQGYISVF